MALSLNTFSDKDTGYYTDHAYVQSSNLDEVFYDDETQVLTILFLNGGGAAYREVPRYIYENLVNAASVGRFYNANIKPVFSGTHRPPNLVPRKQLAVQGVENLTQSTFNDLPRLTFKYVVEVEVVQKIEVEAASEDEALRQAEKVGRPTRITREL